MNILLMGQLLLGFLVAVSILVNISLVGLGQRQRRSGALLPPFIVLLLRWLPWMAALMVVGGVALGESSLLGYQQSPDVNGLGWFVLGASLSIFADVCAAMTLITLREALKVTDATIDLATALTSLAAQALLERQEQDEE